MQKTVTIGLIGILLFACLGVAAARSCNDAGVLRLSEPLSCQVASMAAQAIPDQTDHTGILPQLTISLAIATFGSLFLVHRPPKILQKARMRYRRRFLHAVLPRYGPQNQMNRRCIVAPQRDP